MNNNYLKKGRTTKVNNKWMTEHILQVMEEHSQLQNKTKEYTKKNIKKEAKNLKSKASLRK